MHARITLTALFIAGIIGLSACALNDKRHVTRQTIKGANDFDFWLGDWAVRQRILKEGLINRTFLRSAWMHHHFSCVKRRASFRREGRGARRAPT